VLSGRVFVARNLLSEDITPLIGEVNEIIKTAQKLNFTNNKLLSSDTTVQEPAIGYPNEPGILKGWADRINSALTKLTGRGVNGAKEGMEK
jgi:hypothetical protein